MKNGLQAVLTLLLFVVPERSHAAEQIPAVPTNFLDTYCLDCHDADTEKGEVNLDFLEIDWKEEDARNHWERVLEAIDTGNMPPEKKSQPSGKEKDQMISWLDKSLTRHTKTGGTVLRRLNRAEYQNTIQKLFSLNLPLPEGFPLDSSMHHFDTDGDSLILSPPLMEAYTEAATAIADEIFPPIRPAPESTIRIVAAEELVISYSSGRLVNGALRLASKCAPISRSSTWPSKIELKASGIYRIKVDAAAFAPVSDEPFLLHVLAKEVSSNDFATAASLRRLQEIKVTTRASKVFEFEAELYEGETILFYWANAPIDSDRKDKASLQEVFREKFASNPRYLAAWQKLVENNVRGGFRGGLGWDRVKKFMATGDLDLSNATMDSAVTKELLKKIAGNPVLFTETIAYDFFENGPSLEIHGGTIEGPLSLVPGPKDLKREKAREQIQGDSEGDLSLILKNFLTQAFRRPASEETIALFKHLVTNHQEEGHSFEQGLHLAIRTVLISPRFLYHSWEPGKLDSFDLANRLSYFLTSSPPDSKLFKLALEDKLTAPKTLREQAIRLLPKNESAAMIRNFTGQWLDTDLLPEIMPDPRLKFTDDDQKRARQEVEMFFAELLKQNRPMADFIDPDFTFTSASIAKKVYGIKKGYNAKSKNMQRIELPRGGRHGGILGQAAVLMATANGVDTQPVIRGVWVLENVLGDPPPPPPKAVPAITPDTTGATTPRELLAAHASEESCAACHKKIDPIGFALENFDPVGRWRENYPIHTKDEKGRPVSKPGPPIDTRGTLPDGTPIADILDLKKWIVTNIDDFSECLSEKLLAYATGREPNYVERKEIAGIVDRNHGNGFQDLLLDLIESDTFRTK